MKARAPRHHRTWRTARTPAAAALSLLLAGCQGDNLFPSTGLDLRAPLVAIEAPVPGQMVAVGDSVFVRVQLSDGQALARAELAGVSLRGVPNLGTATLVPRFEPRTVTLDHLFPPVRDTVITRFLLAAPDSAFEEQVLVTVTAWDEAGNARWDAVPILIVGP